MNTTTTTQKQRPYSRASSKIWAWTKAQSARKFFSLCRWLHIYLSTALFSLLILFSFTGITLNHPDWFQLNNEIREYQIELPGNIQAKLNANQPAIDQIKQYIEKTTGLIKPRSIDIDDEEKEISFDYPLPAGYAFVTLSAQTASMVIEYKQGSIIALLNDLHKGRHTDETWSWLIDVSAIALIVMSLTGLIILIQNSQKRSIGLIIVFSGTMLPLLVFLAWVPSFGLE